MNERKLDAPRWLLDFFRYDDARETVRWATNDELREEPPIRAKRVPFGTDAGGRAVMGHGRLVCFSGRNLLTCDIAAAILAGYEWPWDAAKPYVVPSKPGDLPRTDHGNVDFIRATWGLSDCGVVWLKDVPPYYPQHSVVKGTIIAGRREAMITRHGVGYMLKDIKHVLTHGTVPGARLPQIEWN